MKCAAVGAVSMMGRPPQDTKAAHRRLNQRPAVAAIPVMPATIRDGMNTAAAAPMHATRAAEKPRSRPRDDRRPNRTRLGGAAGAVSVMACAHFCSWGAAGHAAFGWARGGWAIAGLVVSQAVAPLGAPLRPKTRLRRRRSQPPSRPAWQSMPPTVPCRAQQNWRVHQGARLVWVSR